MAEIGIESRGLATILENLLGPESMIKDLVEGKMELKDILTPITDSTKTPLREIKNIMDKVIITAMNIVKKDETGVEHCISIY